MAGIRKYFLSYIWTSGYQDIWLSGYLDIWISGYLDIGYLDIWISGHWISGYLRVSEDIVEYLWMEIWGGVGSESVDGADKDNPELASTLFQHLQCHNQCHHHDHYHRYHHHNHHHHHHRRHHYEGWLIRLVEYKPQ